MQKRKRPGTAIEMENSKAAEKSREHNSWRVNQKHQQEES